VVLVPTTPGQGWLPHHEPFDHPAGASLAGASEELVGLSPAGGAPVVWKPDR
jgi:hypothetical protein